MNSKIIVKKLTEQEAAEYTDENEKIFPYRTLSRKGRAEVARFVHRHGKTRLTEHVLNYYYKQVDHEAAQCVPGESVILEIPSRDSKTGRPETLELYSEYFVWYVQEYVTQEGEAQ